MDCQSPTSCASRNPPAGRRPRCIDRFREIRYHNQNQFMPGRRNRKTCQHTPEQPHQEWYLRPREGQ